jgi:hypothetical protein
MKFIINNTKFVSLTCDEVTSMATTSWAMRMVMLCKIGVGYPCYYMSNKCLMNLESTFSFFDHHEFFDDTRGFEGKGGLLQG